MTNRETFDAFFRTILEDKDVDAWMRVWADDPTITMWGSDLDEVAHGPDEIRALGDALAATTLTFHWDDVQVHERGAVAWVNARGNLAAGGHEHPYRVTVVIVDGRVHTFDGSIPD